MTDVTRSRTSGFTSEQAKFLSRGFVGEIKYGTWVEADIPEGWLKLEGLTIGNDDSGASERANNDTWELFNLLWLNASDANCPIQTSGGAGSTRGASAIADWRANKRMVLPDHRGKHPIAKATSSPASGLLETGGQTNHTHTTKAHFHGMGTGADLNITASGSHAHTQTYQTGVAAVTEVTAVSNGNSGNNLTNINTATHTHSSGDFAGRIGLVTGGLDGNQDQGTTAANGPYYTVYAIIAY